MYVTEKSHVFPAVNLTLPWFPEGLAVKMPAQPEAHFVEVYGEDWRTPSEDKGLLTDSFNKGIGKAEFIAQSRAHFADQCMSEAYCTPASGLGHIPDYLAMQADWCAKKAASNT